MRHSGRYGNLYLAVAIVLAWLLAGPAYGVDTYWQHDPNTPGDWHDPNNWTLSLPDTSYTAYIIYGEIARYGYILHRS